MRILVVEDNELAAHFLRRTLEKMQYVITTAGDGAHAWELLQKEHFDIVISDWVMPQMDGLELCQRLRGSARQSYTYIILLTAKDHREDRLEGLRSGADDFLVKPMDPAELTARIEVGRRILAMQTELADTIRHLEVANYRFSELYMGLPIACITYAPDGRIQEWNRACETLFGLHVDQVLKRTLVEALGESAREAPDLVSASEVFAGSTVENREWAYWSSDGRPRYLLSNMFPMLDLDGVIIGAISTHVDITTRIEYERQAELYSRALERQKRQLEEANARLSDLATTDGLTGLKNHRAFQERLTEEIQRGGRYYTPLSLMILDVDHFKLYNDAFGHPAGDQVLKKLGQVLRSNARATDFVARYGGEEFAILLPHTDAAGSMEMAERIRASVEAQRWRYRPITISIGVAALEAAKDDAHAIVEDADKALYAAKSQGRNRVSFYKA